MRNYRRRRRCASVLRREQAAHPRGRRALDRGPIGRRLARRRRHACLRNHARSVCGRELRRARARRTACRAAGFGLRDQRALDRHVCLARRSAGARRRAGRESASRRRDERDGCLDGVRDRRAGRSQAFKFRDARPKRRGCPAFAGSTSGCSSLLLACTAGTSAFAQSISQTFTQSTATGWTLSGNALLTVPSIDAAGSGWLRLTGAATYEYGTAQYTAGTFTPTPNAGHCNSTTSPGGGNGRGRHDPLYIRCHEEHERRPGRRRSRLLRWRCWVSGDRTRRVRQLLEPRRPLRQRERWSRCTAKQARDPRSLLR